MSGGRPIGYVRKPIRCPGSGPHLCNRITAVPIDDQMWLTEAAAGFYPHGYRCWTHKHHNKPDVVPQPVGAPRRLSERPVPVTGVLWEAAS